MKTEKKLLKDIENAYRITISDIKRYIRQTGTININVVKKFICMNYFKNTNAAKIWTYEDEGVNNFILAIDMFELQLWILENYDIEPDKLDSIEDELNFLTTFYINKP